MSLIWRHSAIAIATLAAATAARWLLDPFLGANVPYVTYFVAIVFIAWRTSTPVAFVSAAASWLIAAWLFIPPRFDPLSSAAAAVSSIAYVLVVSGIVFVADRMRRAREVAERSERQLEMISHRLPALVSLVSPDGHYVWCNDEYTRWFGLARDRIVGRRVAEVVGADAWRTIELHLASALAGNIVEYEAESPYAHGGTRWVHVTYAPHRDETGQVQGVVSMVTDIGDRKRAELNASLLADLSLAFARLPTAEDAARQVSERLVFGLDKLIG